MRSPSVKRSRRTPPNEAKATLASCAIVLDTAEIRIPASAYTLAGFRDWASSDAFAERGRVSFIKDEVIVDMSPEKIETHNKVKTEVTRVIANLNARLDLGEVYSDRTLLTNTAADLSTEPDGAFAKWESLESGQMRLVRREDQGEDYLEIEGAPDWVLEIVSDSSVRKDTQLLRQQYHQAGIPEYWLIDARGEEVAFQILIHAPDGYVQAQARGAWQHSPVFGRGFHLERQRGRLGLWRYTLRVRPAR